MKKKYDFGERVRTRRKELGLTQKTLAKSCSIAQDEVSKLECGKIQHIEPNLIRNLAQELRVSSDWLLELEPVK